MSPKTVIESISHSAVKAGMQLRKTSAADFQGGSV